MTQKSHLHVIFGAGPLGVAIARELVASGNQVRIVTRSGKGNIPVGVENMKGDASDPQTTRAACEGAAVVYNCTNALYTEWARLLPPLEAGIVEGAAYANAKLVSAENLYMYGPTHGKKLTEDMPYAATGHKGVIRAQMAEALIEAHKRGKVRVAIGRASDYFGPEVLESVAGDRLFYPAVEGKNASMPGNIDTPHTYTYVPDFARGLIVLGERDEALGQVWHIPNAPTVSTREFAAQAFQVAGQTPRVSAIPSLMISALGLFMPMMREIAETNYQRDEPFVVDHNKYERAFGNHATPLADALSQTIAWFSNHPRPLKADARQTSRPHQQ